jgi:hypothetical protein
MLGYKLRQHISNAITRRSSAIRTALEKYNQLAPLQHPPRPVLEYSEVASYCWLGEFELLKHSRHDLLSKPWASKANREVASKHFKVVRAFALTWRLHVSTHGLTKKTLIFHQSPARFLHLIQYSVGKFSVNSKNIVG